MAGHIDIPLAPVSWGELIDKITILEIKSVRLASPAAVENVRRELGLLSAIADQVSAVPALSDLKAQLMAVNASLWDIEDDIRMKEKEADFGDSFVALARSVYGENDRRAAIKRAINALLGSGLVEEKGYAGHPGSDYDATG